MSIPEILPLVPMQNCEVVLPPVVAVGLYRSNSEGPEKRQNTLLSCGLLSVQFDQVIYGGKICSSKML